MGLDHLALLLGQEGAAVGEVDNQEVAKACNDDSQNTLNDENPAPTRVSLHAVHHRDSITEKVANSANRNGGDVEEGRTMHHLAVRVPTGNQVGSTGEQAGLECSQQCTHGSHGTPGVGETQSNRDAAPEESRRAKPEFGTESPQTDLSCSVSKGNQLKGNGILIKIKENENYGKVVSSIFDLKACYSQSPKIVMECRQHTH
jgi:hypothetical protein